MATMLRTLCIGSLLVLCAYGCGGAQRPGPANAMHVRLDGAGRALVEADKLYVCHDRAAHGDGVCNGRPVRLQDWNAHVEAWDRLRSAISDGYKTMLAAEVAMQAWEAGDKRAWNGAVPCVARALGSVKRALEELDRMDAFVLPTPPALTDVPPCSCTCGACGDDFYPYDGALPQPEACATALDCK